MEYRSISFASALLFISVLTGCGGSGGGSDSSTTQKQRLSEELTILINSASNGHGLAHFTLPESNDLTNIPQDASNPITAEKIALGQMLYHDSAIGTEGTDMARATTYSCASCHHVAAGFKAGIPQGIGDGGSGFGINGDGRIMGANMNPQAPAGDPSLPDIQPLASPAVLNVAYQDVMLWNGQFGNSMNGVINQGIDPARLSTPGTPKAANSRQLSGVEIQAIAGLGVHRMSVEGSSVLQTLNEYQALFSAAYPNSTDILEDAAKAIAAYERSILANEAPFQQWLKGNANAMSESELRGAIVFFGKANCSSCHTGAALSSDVGATADEVFFAVGFNDFDTSDSRIHGTVGVNDRLGRGGFTGNIADNYKFKIPQLYNLIDSPFYGHGSSFNSIKAVVEYKNVGIAQNPAATASGNLATQFVSLNLSEQEINDLTHFIETGLYDANLERYVPDSVPSGSCIPVNDIQSISDIGC